VVGYEQALEALEHVPDSRAATEQAVALRRGLAGALNALGEAPGRMLEHLRRAEALAQTLGDQRRLGRVYVDLSVAFWVAAEVDRAIDYGQRALSVAAALGDVSLQAQASLRLGQVYFFAGDYPRAMESLERNVRTPRGDLLHERVGSMNTVAASSRSWLSRCHAELGAFPEGLALAEDALRMAETMNNPLRLIEACQAVSIVYLRWGDVPRAIPMLERAMGLCQDWHVPLFVPWLATLLGLAYILAGRVAAGLALVEHGVEQEVARGRLQSAPSVVAQLSEAYLRAGRLEEARQRAAQALDLVRQYQVRGGEAWALRLLGDIYAHHDPPSVELAETTYREALSLAEELGMRPLVAHCHLGLGTLYATIGQPEPAHAELSTAIDLYRAMDMTFWLPKAEAALAQVEG
jgi:tetratricopeptide (TPR) repeat protein